MNLHRIEWNDEYKTGVPAIDADHRQLIELANEFLSAAAAEAALHQLSPIMGRLIVHAAEHFAAEESLLDRNGYPDLARHRAEHERLMAQARTLHTRTQASADRDEVWRITHEAAEFFQRWLLEHIIREDKPFRTFVMRLA